MPGRRQCTRVRGRRRKGDIGVQGGPQSRVISKAELAGTDGLIPFRLFRVLGYIYTVFGKRGRASKRDIENEEDKESVVKKPFHYQQPCCTKFGRRVIRRGRVLVVVVVVWSIVFFLVTVACMHG